MLVGEKISALRRQNNLSQGQLADALCVARNTVSRWESGSVIPSIDTLKKLSSYFNVSMEELLDKNAYEEEAFSEEQTVKEKIRIPVWKIVLIVVVGILCLLSLTVTVIFGIITLPMLSEKGLIAYTDDLDPAHFFIALAVTLLIFAAEFFITFTAFKKKRRRGEV